MLLILATAFLDILGIGILIPVLPDIIAHFGVDAAWNPYSQGIYSVGMFLWGLVFGQLSDQYGRKNLLSVTTWFNLLGYITLWLSLSSGFISSDIGFLFVVFLIARFVSGLGGAGFPVVLAYISDISTPANKTKNMGMIGAAFGMAFLIWPAIGGLLSQWGIEYVIFGCVMAITTNLLLILAVLREPAKHEVEMHADHVPFHFSRPMIILFILSFGGALAFSGIQTWSSQFYRDVFGFTATQIGYTLSVVGLVAIIYQGGLIRYVRSYLTDIRMLQSALAIIAISLFLFAINRNTLFLYMIIALFPIGMGSFQPSINSLVAGAAGKEVGKVMGYNTSVISIANIIGPFAVGTLYAISHSLPFLVASGIACWLFILAIVGLRK
jgi:MFS family permease